MTKIHVSRIVQVPDLIRLSRYKKIPELGPRILFFSGGTALTGLSKTLKNYTHNSIHLVSPFDSGGSSAKLRQAFDMPAIGDLRSRLMALADETVLGHPEIFHLFSYRFDKEANQAELKTRLVNMVEGDDPLIDCIANPMRQLICHHLGYFVSRMPDSFDLRGASIGNLIITGGYLNNHEQLDPILFLFSKLVNVLGTVRNITNDNYQLAVELNNGEHIIGQHLMTGKEVPKLSSGIKRLSLSSQLTQFEPVTTKLKKRNRKLIEQADLICYPPGSFFSSLIANLLPEGVGRAITKNGNPKVFIPNLGNDPEQLDMTLEGAIEYLIDTVRKDSPDSDVKDIISIILLDSQHIEYPGGIPYQRLSELNIQIIDTPLIDMTSPYYDDDKLVAAILSLT
jgi:CofD-related protein of GAK system